MVISSEKQEWISEGEIKQQDCAKLYSKCQAVLLDELSACDLVNSISGFRKKLQNEIAEPY